MEKSVSTKWWEEKKDIHSAVTQWAHVVEQQNSGLLAADRLLRQLYQPGRDSGFSLGLGALNSPVKYNLVSSCIDTAASLVASLKPLPVYLTNMGDWSLQRIVRQRTRVLDGLFADLDIHTIGVRVFFGAAVSSFGAAFVTADPVTNKPTVELVNAYELDIDYNEASCGRPRTIVRRHFVDRAQLSSLYEKKKFIETADGPTYDDFVRHFMSPDTSADLVKVYEAWRLPSYEGATDGRHVLCTSNGVLVDEPYYSVRHRIVTYSWKPDINGNLYGTSIAGEVIHSQAEINALIKRVRDLQNVMSGGYVLVRRGSKVQAEKITNFPGQVLSYEGAKPDWQITSGTPVDLQQQIERIEERVYKQLGLNPASIQGSREPGITSGAGQRTMQDIRSQRHVLNARAFIKFYTNLAEVLVDVLDELSEKDPDYEVSALVNRGPQAALSTIRWADLRLDDGSDVRFKMADISSSPTTPQGKLEAIEDFLRMGFIDRRWAMKQLELPDTSAYVSLETASLEYILWQMEQLADGDVVFPQEYSDLALASETATKVLQQVEMNGADAEIIWNFRNYLMECDRMLAASQPPAPPAAAPTSLAPTQGSPTEKIFASQVA